MTALEVLAQSFVLGLGIAMPVGPIGVLVIRRSLTEGRNYGIASGLGAATADGLYGLIATLGLGLIASLLEGIQFYTRLIGGVFLLYLAWQIYNSKPSQKAANAKNSSSLIGAYISTLLLTFSNPATILFFFGVVSSLKISGHGWAVVLGFFLGSALWWVALSSIASSLGSRMDSKALHVVNIVSSLVIAGFAIYAFSGLLLP
jgi:threonine/homoserine/homoserine lactone efflux protein